MRDMQSQSAQDRPLFGAAMIVAGMSIIGVADNFVRVYAEHAGLWQFHFTRALLALPLILAASWALGWRLRPRRMGWSVLRSALLVTSMLLYFGSLPMAPIAQVAAGLFTSPIWVLVFSVALFRAPVGPRRVLAVGVGFIGVLMILRPWETAFTAWSLVPVASGLFLALANLVTRRACAEEPALGLNLLFFTGLGLAGAAGLAVMGDAGLATGEASFFRSGWVWPLPGEAWAVIVMQAVVSVLAVFLITTGYQSADTSFMTLFDYTFLLTAGVTGWLVWGEALGPLALAGMALIVAAGAFIAQRSARG